VPYATPAPYAHPLSPPRPDPGVGPAQAVFDTVAGPNVRLKDNLIQLACVIVGAIAGGAGGWWYGGGRRAEFAVFGVIIGLFVSLVLSGVVIGIVRFFTAVKRR